jgi:hypothetical protein
VSEFCPTLFSSHVSALPNPHTPKGVVVGQSFCLTCRTFAYPWVGQVGHSTVSSAQRDAAGRAHRTDPTDLQVVGRLLTSTWTRRRQPARARMPPVGCYSVWLRRRVGSRRLNFFYFFVPREVYGTDNFDFGFGFTDSKTARIDAPAGGCASRSNNPTGANAAC